MVTIKRRLLYAVLLAKLAGCAYQFPLSASPGHVGSGQDSQKNAAPLGQIPKPVKKLTYVPFPKPKIKEPTYSVVVSDVPVREVLFALARESRLNVDVHPSVGGLVTMNAVDQTLPAILGRIAKQLDIVYKIENNAILITRDIPYLKTYQVDYVNMHRKTESKVAVAARIGGGSGTGSTGSSSGGGDNESSSTVDSRTANDFWNTLVQNIKDILAETDKEVVIGRRSSSESQQQGSNATVVSVASGASTGGASQGVQGQQNAEKDYKDFKTLFAAMVIAHPETGLVSVRATSRQHEKIQEFLDKVLASARRQVLIEATIAVVGLSDQYKAGINWSRLAQDGSNNGITFGFGRSDALTKAGSSDDFVVNYVKSTALGNLSASIKLLDTFGTTKVLSSPKLMVLNNQTSILKVVENLVYFSVKADTTTPQTGPSLTTYTTTANTIPVGLVMSLTPQISSTGLVTLLIRPTVSRKVSEGVKDPNPNLKLDNLVPVIQSMEMESMLQLESGQIAILGGLMQDDITKTSTQVPKISSIPVLGSLFKSKSDIVLKTELVIFLRATVVSDPSLESEELKSFKRYLPENQFPVVADEPVN